MRTTHAREAEAAHGARGQANRTIRTAGSPARADETEGTGVLRSRPRADETADDLGLPTAAQSRPLDPEPAAAGGAARTATGCPVVGVLPTGDAISELALDSFVKQCPHLLWTGDARAAEVAVAALHNPDTLAVTRLRGHTGERTSLVLVVGGEWRTGLHQAIELGVRAVLPRAGFTWEAFIQTVRGVRAGHADLPPALQGRLMDQMQYTYREVLMPRGLTPGGLTEREAKVLQLVADGHELQDIGNRLGYSERTIKNVLYGVIKRHRLRNRSHAVSFAIRSGLI